MSLFGNIKSSNIFEIILESMIKWDFGKYLNFLEETFLLTTLHKIYSITGLEALKLVGEYEFICKN